MVGMICYDEVSQSFIALYLQMGIDAMHHLRIDAQKRPKPVLSLLSLTQAGRESVNPSGSSGQNFQWRIVLGGQKLKCSWHRLI